MLYHVSQTNAITELIPKVSTHGVAYVYAVRNLSIGLLFGAINDDFDFIITDDGGKPVVYECYPGAFDRVYSNKSCSIYELDDKDFKEGITGWDMELVCEHPVKVQKEIIVVDLKERILEEVRNDNLILYRYEFSEAYKKMVAEHITDRLIRFKALDYIKTDERFKKYYRGIIEALYSVMDGHLLK